MKPPCTENSTRDDERGRRLVTTFYSIIVIFIKYLRVTIKMLIKIILYIYIFIKYGIIKL